MRAGILAPGNSKRPHPLPPPKSDSPLPREVGSWGCSSCSTYSWKSKSTAGERRVRTGWSSRPGAGKRAGRRGGAAHLSGRSRCWRCSGGPLCLQTRPATFRGSTGPGTSAGAGRGLSGRTPVWARVAGDGRALTELSVSPCRITGLTKAYLERSAESRPGPTVTLAAPAPHARARSGKAALGGPGRRACEQSPTSAIKEARTAARTRRR